MYKEYYDQKKEEEILEKGNFADEFLRSFLEKRKDKYIKITIDESKFKELEDFAKSKAEKKQEEHRYDNRSEGKRNLTGVLGEYAVETLLGIKIIDYSLGSSKDYDTPDLVPAGYKVGVKTVSLGYAPVVPLNPEYPQIICLREGRTIYICGIADISNLKEYQSTKFIKDAKLRAKNIKTGFYGFHKLIAISSLPDLDQWKI